MVSSEPEHLSLVPHIRMKYFDNVIKSFPGVSYFRGIVIMELELEGFEMP